MTQIHNLNDGVVALSRPTMLLTDAKMTPIDNWNPEMSSRVGNR